MFKKALPLVALLFIACGDSGDEFENYCVGVDCGSHGRCAVGAEGPICICDFGFVLQDGVCAEFSADNPCKDVTCSGHGVCMLTPSYEPVCVCNEGYQRDGQKCVAVPNPCDNFDCGEHGRCGLGNDGPFCICDDGFVLQGGVCKEAPTGGNPCKDVECAGDGVCTIAYDNTPVCLCRPGYQSNGAQCVKVEGGGGGQSPCTDVDCGSNGSCVVTSDNKAFCLCDEGYYRHDNRCTKVDDSVVPRSCFNDWCLIPSGTFEMGAPEEDTCPLAGSGEKPVHPVTISRPFHMKQTEVTQKEWAALIANNQHPSAANGCDDCPVTNINWFDVLHYANLLSLDEGYDECYEITDCEGTLGAGAQKCTVEFKGLDCNGYRLPTEAEWEYAARAGTKTAYWIGSYYGDNGEMLCNQEDPLGTLLPQIAWYDYNSEGPKLVGRLLPNPWGLYDMNGNVFEWVWDLFHSSYYHRNQNGVTDPLGPDPDDMLTKRCYRGGAFNSPASLVRSASRSAISPSSNSNNLGLRLVRTAVP